MTHYIRLSNDKVVYIREQDNRLQVGFAKEVGDYNNWLGSHTWICHLDSDGVHGSPNCHDEIDELTSGLEFTPKEKKTNTNLPINQVVSLFQEKFNKMTLDEWNKYLERINVKSVDLMKSHVLLFENDYVILPDPGRVQSFLMIQRQLVNKILVLGELPP